MPSIAVPTSSPPRVSATGSAGACASILRRSPSACRAGRRSRRRRRSGEILTDGRPEARARHSCRLLDRSLRHEEWARGGQLELLLLSDRTRVLRRACDHARARDRGRDTRGLWPPPVPVQVAGGGNLLPREIAERRRAREGKAALRRAASPVVAVGPTKSNAALVCEGESDLLAVAEPLSDSSFH